MNQTWAAERFRDFNVPASILDEIFNNQDDLNKLTDAWETLQKDNFNSIYRWFIKDPIYWKKDIRAMVLQSA